MFLPQPMQCFHSPLFCFCLFNLPLFLDHSQVPFLFLLLLFFLTASHVAQAGLNSSTHYVAETILSQASITVPGFVPWLLETSCCFLSWSPYEFLNIVFLSFLRFIFNLKRMSDVCTDVCLSGAGGWKSSDSG